MPEDKERLYLYPVTIQGECCDPTMLSDSAHLSPYEESEIKKKYKLTRLRGRDKDAHICKHFFFLFGFFEHFSPGKFYPLTRLRILNVPG